ncbi:hypothetical protein CLAFUW4_02335 [Fulvia fulva]|uniref:Uncharacterized protein n=1 Tax=Passalora fulva TaxID=5499 RepID=A0A9Q8LA27_PASFU|nr:uncharacterized protein CLAFUR5_02324 [Fulvia fulva]KAK4631796.1 hypothetical protein CLAFUR4_02330 [Fulvia fulva]KAK4633647.1 hypothetical protein CLAFUR0_02334 [Fulvia fulva]UJO13701.1 hypothetical protein CLAFUR5_02324 [Fulvia fulva]WPV11188.1 hypothetical protein CLAFUW4_02335 [Fulvia fulva]WPV25814.1 hypothetical protein CLAFUW7_02335 [Fulvia fulva]
MNSIARQVPNRLSSSTGMSETSIHPAHRSGAASPQSSSSSLSGASNSSRFSKISQTFTPWITGVPTAETYRTQAPQQGRKSSSSFPILDGKC